MGSGPQAIMGMNLEGKFEVQTNHHPPESYYRLPFADDVIQHQGMNSLRREMALSVLTQIQSMSDRVSMTAFPESGRSDTRKWAESKGR